MSFHNAHAALIVDNTVRDVIVIPYMDDDDKKITAYCNSLGLEGSWIDTSFTGARRGKFAGIGDYYDQDNDRFITPTKAED